MLHSQNSLPDINDAHLNQLPQRPDRIEPLGEISIFVKESLADRLQDIRAKRLSISDLADEVKILLTKQNNQLSNVASLDLTEKHVALLDLSMIMNAIQTHHGIPPQELAETMASLAKDLGIVDCLTYGLVVRTNPIFDTRTFTKTKTEREFYVNHEIIEQELTPITKALREAIKLCVLPEVASIDCPKIISHFSEASSRLQGIKTLMAQFIGIDRDEFSLFRQYFFSEGQHPGPSGLFSGNMAAINIMLLGEKLESDLTFAEKHILYYPKYDRPSVDFAIETSRQQNSLLDILTRDPKSAELIQAAIPVFARFGDLLRIHRAAILKTLAEAYQSNSKGTGGRPIKDFTDRGVNRYVDAINALELKHL